jgi:hypothetical protein
MRIADIKKGGDARTQSGDLFLLSSGVRIAP